MWLFFGIYSALTLSVVFAVYMLRLASPQNNEPLLSETTAAPSLEEKKTAPKKTPAPEVAKKKAATAPTPKKPEEKKPLVKTSKPAKTQPDNSIEVEKQILAQYPDPKITPLLEIVSNWQNIPPKAVPKMVAIRVPVEFEIKEGGKIIATGKLPIGATMSVRKLDNGVLSLSAGSSMPVTAALRIDETDLKERIQARYDSFVRKKMEGLESQRNAERKRILKAIANEEALAVYNDGSDPRFDPLKNSLRKGEAGATIELESAVKWKWMGKETIDGVEYDTAYVVIESETAFGLNEKEIKCALLNGKVAHWYDARSGNKL